jgi:hypothetical protein
MKKLLTILACTLLAVLLMPAFIHPPARDDVEHESVADQGLKLLAAFEAYHAEFGAYPTGSAASIMRELRGENAKQTVFFECREESLNEAGELLDPWGNPFQITFEPETGKPLLHSAGKNRIFEPAGTISGDDYRSWQTRDRSEGA